MPLQVNTAIKSEHTENNFKWKRNENNKKTINRSKGIVVNKKKKPYYVQTSLITQGKVNRDRGEYT